MSGVLDPSIIGAGSGGGWSGGWRWGLCLAIALALHAGTGALLLGHTSVTAEPPPALTPVDLTPSLPELEAAETPLPTAAEAPPRPAAAQPAISPEQALPLPPLPPPPPPPPPRLARPTPPPRPAPPRRTEQPSPTVDAPAPAALQLLPAAPAPTAPTAPAPAPRPAASPASVASWQSRLYGHLLRLKRYPPEAQMRRQEGTPVVQFTVTRDGRLLSSQLARSSGNDLLDQEALALVQRAQPLPAFAEDMPEATRTVIVPVQFSLR